MLWANGEKRIKMFIFFLVAALVNAQAPQFSLPLLRMRMPVPTWVTADNTSDDVPTARVAAASIWNGSSLLLFGGATAMGVGAVNPTSGGVISPPGFYDAGAAVCRAFLRVFGSLHCMAAYIVTPPP